MTDGDGGPLGAVIAGANVVDQKLLKATIAAKVVERPDPVEMECRLHRMGRLDTTSTST